MVTVSGNPNPTNPTYPTNPTNPTNPTTKYCCEFGTLFCIHATLIYYYTCANNRRRRHYDLRYSVRPFVIRPFARTVEMGCKKPRFLKVF